MSLCFLVEGDRTEKRLYRAWVNHAFPHLAPATTVAAVGPTSFCVISGGGIPLYKDELRDVLRDIGDNKGVRDLFVCIDAEDLSYEERLAEMELEIHKAEVESGVRLNNPALRIHPIVQNCCVETWFLGHTKMMRRHPTSERLRDYREFFDVCAADPEQMGTYTGFRNRADFHLHYLKEMLLEQSPTLIYTKKRPDPVLGPDYLSALRQRCHRTGHLASLRRLFEIWETLNDRTA